MYITINDKTYSDSTLAFNPEQGTTVATLKTGESIAEVAAAFDGQGVIRVYDDQDTETGVWYLHAVTSIYEKADIIDGEPREVVVSFKSSALSSDTETALANDIGENTDAILELGSMIVDTSDLEERITEIEGILNGIPSNMAQRLGAIDSAYNALADRVAKLENRSVENG